MPGYNYKARDNTGKLVRGTMPAATEDEVALKLRKMGYAPVTINSAIAALKIEQFGRAFARISAEDMAMFNVQLSNMINSGLDIRSSLQTLQKQIENRKLKIVVGSIVRSIEGGESFSQALEKHPAVFSSLFISMVRAGEASGNLDKVLTRYAEFAENQADLQQKVSGALFYPAVLIVAATLIIVFIVTTIIPKFVEIFSRAGIRLPLPTVILYRTGTFIRNLWYVILLAPFLGVFAVKKYIRTASGRFRIDRISLKIPVSGSLIRKTCISRFARTLSTLLASGVPVLESLDIVRGVVNNEVLGRVIGQMRQAAEKGEGLAETLKVSEEFPPDTVQMISVGEATGRLEGMLNKISDFYDRSIGYSIKKLTTILEPVFLIIMGVIVAFIMASMLLPMFDMMKLLRT